MAKDKRVTSKNYPYLETRIQVRNKTFKVQTLIDTGFTGHIAIPDSLFNGNLGLPDTRTDWQLADGSIVSAPVYLGHIEIIGIKSINAYITVLGNEYIIGRGVIDRLEVTFDHGKKITVRP